MAKSIVVMTILFGLMKGLVLPVTIYSGARDTIQSADLSSAERDTFNAMFTSYEGTQKGVVVKVLVDSVRENNSGSDRIVSINFKGKTYSNNDISLVSDLIKTSDTYNVTMKYDSNGYVETIIID